MGIQSRIRIQYFRDDVLVPLSNVMLYPNGSDVVHTADIDQSILDAVFDGVEAAWDAVTIGVDLLSGNWLAAGFSAADLADNLSALKNDLADKTRVDVTSLGLSYPHLLYNKLHIIFEADSTSDGSGDMDPLTDPGHSPAAGLHTPIVQFSALNGSNDHHRRVGYVVDLDELHRHSGALMFGEMGAPRPFAFTFATKETDAFTTTLGVVQGLKLEFYEAAEVAPLISTDIVYWMKHPQDEIGSPVSQQRIMSFTPTVDSMNRGAGDAVQLKDVTLTNDGGRFLVNGTEYNLIGVRFTVNSRRRSNATRPVIEIDAASVPTNGGIRPSVVQPCPTPAVDGRNQMYLAEGIGSASFWIAAGDMPISPKQQIVFSADQQPGGWTCQQVVRFGRVIVAPPVGDIVTGGMIHR